MTALGQFVLPQRDIRNYNLAGLLFCLGVFLFQLGFILNGMVFRFPAILSFHCSLMFLTAPLLYFAYHLVVLPEEELSRKKLLYFLPSVPAFIADIQYILLPAGSQKTVIDVLYHGRTVTVYIILIKVLIAGAAVQVVVYQAVLFKEIVSFWKLKEQSSILYITIIYIILSSTAMMLMTAGYEVSSMPLLKAGTSLFSFLVVAAYFVSQRHPQFLQLLTAEVEKKRYARSRLEGIETNPLREKLDKLMLKEKLYADEDVTLKQVADMLNLTPHQLSQFLNERLNMNFNRYINKFRVDEAKELLISEPDRSVLSIAYAVGFNSKTSFYDAFSRFTGKTPHKFRKDSEKTV